MIGKVKTILIWNDQPDGKPMLGWELVQSEAFKAEAEKIPAVIRPTDYSELYTLLKTTGCTPEEPYWDWSVCATVKTVHGRQVIWPGCAVVVYENDIVVVLTPQKLKTCLPALVQGM